MTSRLRIPGRDDRLPLLPLPGLVNNHSQVTFRLSSETLRRIVEQAAQAPWRWWLVMMAEPSLVAARDEVQEEIELAGSLAGRLDRRLVGTGRGGLLPPAPFPVPARQNRTYALPRFQLSTNVYG